MNKEKLFSKFNIHINSLSSSLPRLLSQKQYSQLFILVDDKTNHYCHSELIREVPELRDAKVIEIFSGEAFKNIRSVEKVWQALSENFADRNSALINLGGGMIGDLGGFAAATYKRGIDFIHIPTTLLAQVDAAIGGKQAVDYLEYKNQVGVFKQPTAVFIQATFLKTLPPDHLKSGLAEIVKHTLLKGKEEWSKMKSLQREKEADWSSIISDSVVFKLSVVNKDEREEGVRKILNFGHTIGHAVESFWMRQRKEVLHGWCIACGMIGEAYLSNKIAGLAEKQLRDITLFLKSNFRNVLPAESEDVSLIELMEQDKKNRNGKIFFSLLKKIGKPVIDVPAEKESILDALAFIRKNYS